MTKNIIAATAATLLLACAGAGLAAEPAATIRLTLKDHRFTPDALDVPAGRRIRIELVNEDPASEEFDSEDLHVEKDVTPHGRVTFEVGPLAPGRYAFMGELHADTASGTIQAK